MVLKSESVFRLALVPLEGVARCLCGESDLPEDLRLSSKNTVEVFDFTVTDGHFRGTTSFTLRNAGKLVSNRI